MTMKMSSDRMLLVGVTGALCALALDNMLSYCRREDQINVILVGIGNAMQKAGMEHGPNQGSEGQRDTQKTTDTPAGETGDTENAAGGLPTESGVENGGRRSPAPGGPARGVGG
jgi:hypothetical protein